MATFSAIGDSAATVLAPGRDLALTISGTFVAELEIQRRIGLQGWQRERRVTGSGTYQLPPGTYRLSCTKFTSGTVTYSFATAAPVLAQQRDGNGVLRYQLDADGNISGLASLATALLTLGVEDGLTAHAGGTQAAGLALDPTVAAHRVSTVGSAADSILLPPAVLGAVHFVMNSAASNSMQVFGSGTDTINDVASATGVAQAAGKGALYVCIAAGKWYRALGA